MIHQSSVIDLKAKISKNVKIGPFCFIGPEVQLGDNVELISNVHLEIEAIRSHGRVWKYKGIAKVNGKRMADAEWSATIVDRK